MFQRFFVLAILGCCVSNGFAADRPNVLLIMVDDLRDYVSEYAGWGYFDYRMKDEGFDEGYPHR